MRSSYFDSPKGENPGGQKGKGLSLGGDTYHTKPEIEVDIAGINVDAVRGATVPWFAEPGAATKWLCSICSSCISWQPCATIIGAVFIIVVPIIFAPFPNIPVHIVQSPNICRKISHFSGLVSILSLGTCMINGGAAIIGKVSCNHFSKMKWGFCTRTTSIFPLRFTGEFIFSSSMGRKSLTKLYCIVPTNVFKSQWQYDIRGSGF